MKNFERIIVARLRTLKTLTAKGETMNLIRKVLAAILLMSILEVAAIACSAPVPGIIETPPCAPAQQVSEDPTVPGQIETPIASETFDITSTVKEALITFLLF